MNILSFPKKHLIKLFNLGLHLNNEQTFISPEQNKYGRPGIRDLSGERAVLSNPLWMTYQGMQFLQIFRRLLENDEKFMLINTDPIYCGYEEFFEGSDLVYQEEGWPPGSLTNPHSADGLPQKDITLVVLLSARAEDKKIILSEIRNRDLPVINFSPYPVEKTIFSGVTIPNKKFLHFYLQLIRYSLLTYKKKNSFLLPSSTVEDNDLLTPIENLFSQLKKKKCFQTRKKHGRIN